MDPNRGSIDLGGFNLEIGVPTEIPAQTRVGLVAFSGLSEDQNYQIGSMDKVLALPLRSLPK